MRTSKMLAATLSVFGLSLVPAYADELQGTCSLATMHGTYAYGATGSNAAQTYWHSTSGMESYDGKGHLTWYQIWTDEWGSYTYSGTGTYAFTTLTDSSSGVAVTATCVAKVTYAGYGTWTYFVPPDGSAYFFNNDTPSSLGGGRIERVSLALLVK